MDDKKKRFQSLNPKELQKMRSNSISERDSMLEKYKEFIKYIFNDHYLINGEDESLAYNPTFYTTFEFDIIRKILSFNFPYNPHLMNASNNILSPLVDYIEKDYDVRVKNSRSASQRLKESFDKFLPEITTNVGIHFQNNKEIKQAITNCFRDYFFFGNSCYKIDINSETKKQKVSSVHLNKISIAEEDGEPTYFFQDLKFSWLDVLSYFPEETTKNIIKNKYEEIKDVENWTKKNIDIIQCAYYDEENNSTYVRYFLHNDNMETDLEKQMRSLEYKVYLYEREDTSSTGKLYGNSLFYSTFLRIKDSQRLSYNLSKLREKVSKPRTMSVKHFLQENELQSDFKDGIKTNFEINKQNNPKKILQLNLEHVASLQGDISDRNLEINSLLMHTEATERILEIMQRTVLSTFLGLLEYRGILPEQDRKDLSVFELQQQIKQQADKSAYLIDILEKISAPLYKSMIDACMFYGKKGLLLKLEEHGYTTQNFNEVKSLNYDEIMEKGYKYILGNIEKEFTEEELKNHPFAYLLEDERVAVIREEYSNLKQQINDPEISEEDKYIILNALNVIEKKYYTYIEDIKDYVIKEHLSFYEIENEMFDINTNIFTKSSKEFIEFIWLFNSSQKHIKYELASAEANQIRNTNLQNYRSAWSDYFRMVSQTGDQEIMRKGIIMFDIANQYPNFIKEVFNIHNLPSGKEIEDKYQQMVQEEIARQQQLQSNNQQQQ